MRKLAPSPLHRRRLVLNRTPQLPYSRAAIAAYVMAVGELPPANRARTAGG